MPLIAFALAGLVTCLSGCSEEVAAEAAVADAPNFECTTGTIIVQGGSAKFAGNALTVKGKNGVGVVSAASVLYVDRNRNGQFDSGERIRETVALDPNGAPCLALTVAEFSWNSNEGPLCHFTVVSMSDGSSFNNHGQY